MINTEQKLKIVEVKLSVLNPSEYNPRQASKEECDDLKESIERFGIVDPLLVNSAENRKNIVIGGHFRLKVAKDLGRTTMPVIYLNIPDIEKEKELNLRLNKNLGHWDFDMLADFDTELLEGVGFSPSELDNIFKLDIEKEAFDVEKELEKVLNGERRGVKVGDVWSLGDHKIIVGDSVNRDSWEKLLGRERFDFMFTDPPYKISYCKYGKVKKEGGFGYKANRTYLGVDKKGGVPEFDEWLSIANDFQNPQGVNVMIFENWKNTVELWLAMEKYWKIRNMVIWHLPNRCQGFGADHKFFSKYDIAMLGDAGSVELNGKEEKELKEYLSESGQKLLDTFEVIIYGQKGKSAWDKPKGTPWARVNDHITWVAETNKSAGQSVIFGTKPLQILVPYVKILSPRNGIIVEPFAGSGSTIIACEIMVRKCRAIEFSEDYVEVIINRWEKFTEKKAVKLNG